MKKLKLHLVLLCGLLAGGCSTMAKDEVKPLMKAEKYSEAYSLIQEHPDQYEEYSEEVTMRMAEIAMKEKNYQTVLDVLKDSVSEDARAMVQEATGLLHDATFVKDLAAAMDERERSVKANKAVFSKEAELQNKSAGLDLINKYYDDEFHDPELKDLARQCIDGWKGQVTSVDNWDTDLFKTSLDLISYNGPRSDAIQKINAKYSLPVTEEEAKKTLEQYNANAAAGGAVHELYGTLDLKEISRYGDQVTYQMTGTNASSAMFEVEEGYDGTYVLYGNLLNRNGDLVGKIWDESVPTLRPGQSFTIKAYAEGDIGSLSDYYYQGN